MVDPDIFEYLTERLNNEIKIITETLVDGEVKDFSELQRLKGKIDGLRISQREITEYYNKLVEVV
tara:strand:- start:307 stop:501 length:195 start_codon:yes stop_codon:yes gene_type:complete